MKNNSYYNNLIIRSYNCIWNFINTIRSKGKTWSFCLLAIRQCQKHNKKVLFVRRFKEEAKEAKGKLFNDEFCQKYGLNENNFKWQGYTAYLKVRGKWEECCQITWLAKSKAIRGARDSNTYFIVFDEYTTTDEKYKFYHGNEVEDFIDIVTSKKGNHKIQIFFLGNKETVLNPYYAYFNLPNFDFNGIKTFNNGTIAVENSDIIPDEVKENKFDQKFRESLKNTTYGKYLNGAYKREIQNKVELPKKAKLFVQFDFIGGVSVYQFNKQLYIKENVNNQIHVFVDAPKNYIKQSVILNKDKLIFEPIINAYKYNLINYTSDKANELFKPVLKLLNVLRLN